MALKYELAMLKDIVEKKLDPKMVVQLEMEENSFREMRAAIKAEKERIEDCIREAMLNIKKEHQKKEYILQHHVNVVKIADKVFGYLIPKDRRALYVMSNTFTVDNLYRKVFICLEQLLEFLENDFPDHFDKRVRMPEAKRWLLELEMKEKLQGIKRELKNAGIEDSLVEVACMPLADLLVSEREINYLLYQFLKTLFKKLSSFCHLTANKSVTEKFLRMLWRMNYNSVWVYNYCVVEYDRTVKDAGSITDAIQYLQRQEMMLKQIVVRTDIAFRCDQPSITNQLLGWITEELKLLKDEQAQVKLNKKWAKITTILSVEELGYGCRLLHEQGLFPAIEIGELMELTAERFATPKSKEISLDSIMNKSAKPGPNSKQRVKGYLYETARRVR